MAVLSWFVGGCGVLSGVVAVKLRQAYDLPVSPGTALYVRLALLPWRERLRTATADVTVGKQVREGGKDRSEKSVHGGDQ